MIAPDMTSVSFRDDLTPLLRYVLDDIRSAPTAALQAAERIINQRLARIAEWENSIPGDSDDPAASLRAASRAISQMRIENASAQEVADEELECMGTMLRHAIRTRSE